MRAVLALCLGALCLGASVAAQAPPTVHCSSCRNQGERDCKSHVKFLDLERTALQCSVVAECKRCAGALSTDCGACKNAAVEDAAEQRRALAREWYEQRRQHVDAFTRGDGLLHGKSAHVDLAFSVAPLQIGRVKLSTHQLMHLYLERIEALRARFMAVFELADQDFSARLEVYMFQDRADHATMAPRVAGGGANATGMKFMGAKAVYCMHHDKRQMPGDEGLHRGVVHNVTHLLLSNMKPEIWLGNRKHGWIDEGVAHYFEDLLCGLCTNYCYEEVGVALGAIYKGGKWRVPIRKWAEAGQLDSFPSVAGLNTDQLNAKQRAQSFAFVDFLIARHGGKAFADMVRRIKRGDATRDALRESYGLSILAFDTAFSAWVKETYPLQER